ncbi:MAG TPA: ABC transporter substrate-binding protein, partial [Polyangia bacterium]|nr:ABC transporter substrate-binding protein [Polyangia bacterium]
VTIADTTVTYTVLDATLLGDLRGDRFAYDLVMIPPPRLCGFANNLLDVPADVIAPAQAEATFFPPPLQGATCGGKLKALPVEYNLEYGGVVVNVDKYQAKFPGKTPGWPDWSSFVTEAAALTEYDDLGRPMANGLDIDPDWPAPVISILLSQILQRGGEYWGPTGDLFDFNTPAARDSLAEMVSWVNKSRVMDRSLVPDKNTSVSARLASGATGYGWSDPLKPLSVIGYVGTWGLPSVRGQVPPGSGWHYEWHALPPMVGPEHKFVSTGGWAFAVPKTSKNPKVAWDIARSLALSPAAARKWSAVSGTLPALRANGSPEAAAGDPVLAQVQPLLAHGRFRGYIPVAAIKTAQGAFGTNFFAAAAGTKTVEQALADIQKTANDAIEQNRDP